MEPLISIRLYQPKHVFLPGEQLAYEHQIDAVEKQAIQAVETSVLWYTEGKGDEDLGVHFFERRTPADVEDGDLRQLQVFQTILPNTPLSYMGVILKIQWCVRVRMFLRRGRQICDEKRFQLGKTSMPFRRERAARASQQRQSDE